MKHTGYTYPLLYIFVSLNLHTLKHWSNANTWQTQNYLYDRSYRDTGGKRTRQLIRWCRASCPRMSVDILGTNCDQCVSMVHCCFASTETVRLIGTESPGRPLRLSHSSWTLRTRRLTFCLTSTEARMLIRDGDRGGRGRGSEGSTACTDPEDRGGRGPPPERWKC